MPHRHKLVCTLGGILRGGALLMKSQKTFTGSILFLIFTAVLTVHAMAAPLVFTDRAAFNAAVGSTTLITFDTPVTLGSTPTSHHNIEGFVGNDLRLFADSSGAFAVNHVPGSIVLGGSNGGVFVNTINPVIALGLDATPRGDSRDNGGGPYPGFSELNIAADGNVFHGLDLTTPQFVGFLFDTPTTVRLSGWFSSFVAIDNVAIKTVPEPGSLLLLGAGLAGLIGFRRKLSHHINKG